MTDLTAPLPGRSAWVRHLAAPVRVFLRTETGGSLVLVAALVLALAWANVDPASYARVWTTQVDIRIGSSGISQDLRHWVNDGLMMFFFLIVGLEARREFDLGELRDRRRLTFPTAAALGGMLTAGLCAAALTRAAALAIKMLPERIRLRAITGSSRALVDLAVPVGDRRDHIRGPEKALVTLVESPTAAAYPAPRASSLMAVGTTGLTTSRPLPPRCLPRAPAQRLTHRACRQSRPVEASGMPLACPLYGVTHE
jgi:hypothetical protein